MTKRQLDAFRFIVSFMATNHYNPSYQEIADALGLTSLATVYKHLHALKKRGFVEFAYNGRRSLEITAKGRKKLRELRVAA